jgi:phosphatidylinositol alpha-1,6-mannosyltransferase
MKILFISHTFPPIVGGVESQNFELYVWLSKIAKVKLIANKKRWLIPFFLLYASVLAVFSAKKYDVVLLGSCILGNVGWLVKKLTKKSVIAVAHGLDLTYKNTLYQKFWIKIFIPSLDQLIAVGNETICQGVSRGIPKNKFTFIPNGVDTEKFFASASRLGGPHSREELEKIFGINLADKSVLLTSGRLAKRKGVAWFIRNVIHKFPKNVLYIVAGAGPDRKNIESAIEETGSSDRVKLLGYVSDETRNILFNTADLFIQPNIRVEGDMEGFGISVIEAASCELPVIASRLEGLQDAIQDGENGILVETENSEAFVFIITELMNDKPRLKNLGKQARQYVINNYTWENIARLYLKALEKIAKKVHNG